MKQLDAVQIERLTEIKGQLLNLVSEALDLVRGTPEEQRATTGTRVKGRFQLRSSHLNAQPSQN